MEVFQSKIGFVEHFETGTLAVLPQFDLRVYQDPTGEDTLTMFGPPPSDLSPPPECHPISQDCPEGEKCVPYSSTGGVITASFIIGFAERFTDTYIGSHWTMIVSLAAILLVLTIKPSGLFGKQKELEERI